MARYDEAPPSEVFPGIPNVLSTGAPGSTGISAATTTGAVIGAVPVSVPGASSQLPENRPVLQVHAGDTSGAADDLAAHESVIEPGPQDAYLATGSGEGSTTSRHPNAGH